MPTIQISEILRGCTPGRIQTVGFMQMIPLVSDVVDERIGSPDNVRIKTTDYGTLVIENKDDKVVVVPPQTAYVVKQAAQDHALPHAGIISKKKTVKYDTARCIQQTQGGYISSGDHQMAVLPFPLREVAYKTRNERHYATLWPAIQKLNQEAGVSSSQGNLVLFLDKFKTELDQFIAEFEPIENQVGAIILVSGQVVGIERSPNYDYWKSVWSSLIRECYGSLAIMEARKHSTPPVPKTRSELGEVTSLDDLVGAVEAADAEEYEKVKTVFQNVANLDMKRQKVDGVKDGLTVESLDHKRFLGQIIRDDERIVFGSLIATDKWRKNEDWFTAKSFAM